MNLCFVKGIGESDDLFPLNLKRETLQKSNIIKVVSNKLTRKAIEMLRKLAEKDESKKDKYDDINDETKEVEINDNGELAETENDKLFVDATNDAPPTQEYPATTAAAVTN